MTWLTGCEILASKESVKVISICPVLKKYSVEFNNKLADEITKAGPLVVEVIGDYYTLRRQIEKCR
jgi:hypothetical protein